MKLAVITLIRNEIDIAGAFLQHIDALFDYALVMDHGSIDGTERLVEQACARRPGWTMWHLEPVGYHQRAFNVFALRHMVEHTDADHFMFLDADEFIDVPDRATLDAAFSPLTDPDHVGYLRWRNVVPQRFDTRAIVTGEPLWRVPAPSQLGKVVIPRSFYRRHGDTVLLGHGNHAIYHPPDNSVPTDDVGEMLHMPIRSHAQLESKVVAGVFAVMAQAVREPGRQGAHPLSWPELLIHGFLGKPLEVAFGRPLPMPADTPALDPMRLVATVLRGFKIEDVRNSKLALDGNHVRFVSRESNP